MEGAMSEVIVSGEFRTSGDTATTAFSGVNKDLVLEYAVVGELAIFEGDIVLGTVKDAQLARTRSILAELAEMPLEQFALPKALVDAVRDFNNSQLTIAAVAIVGRRWPNK